VRILTIPKAIRTNVGFPVMDVPLVLIIVFLQPMCMKDIAKPMKIDRNPADTAPVLVIQSPPFRVTFYSCFVMCIVLVIYSSTLYLVHI
jgi:hypothetical protein